MRLTPHRHPRATRSGAEAKRTPNEQSGLTEIKGGDGAVGHNSISLIIPCHRVVGASGSITGYAGGVDKKIALLKTEGADISKLFIPQKGTAL